MEKGRMRRTRKCKVSEKNPPSPVRSNSKGEKVPIGKGVGCARTRNHRGFWALLHTGLGGKKIPIDEGVHETRELGGIGFELGVGSPALERR